MTLRRFIAEVVAFLSCLWIGAVVFHVLEYRENDDDAVISKKNGSNDALENITKTLIDKYNISTREINDSIKELRARLIQEERDKYDFWDFTGCYFFAGTVAFTIGFGHQTPKTSLGQLMVIIYAIIAIPVTGLMLSACGERLAQHQQKLVVYIEKKLLKREPKHLARKTIAMNVFVLILFFVWGSLMTKYYYDGWSMIEGLYFLWICMSTVGFGDYVINDGKPYYKDNMLKTVMLRLNVIVLIIGLCQVSCILVSIQNSMENKLETNISENMNEEDSVQDREMIVMNENSRDLKATNQ